MRPTTLNERYQMLELVGAGGMATVYRGQDVLLDRSVAIKFLREPYASDPEARRRFVEEARAAAKLDHPNIVHIYDVGEDDENRPFIVMEIVDGEDLKSLIRREAPLAVPTALAIARQVCAGVGMAHRNGIVHCDLKPQNIMVTPEGQVKVTDFGIARALAQEETDEADGGRAEVVWGSPHYLAPEQARGHAPTPASDVYSIGIVLYEMLAGVPPFHDADPAVLAMKHVRETPVPITALNPRVPRGLDWLVRKVLAKEPASRYRNADQFGMAIEEYMRRGAEGTAAHPAVAEETPLVPTREQDTPPPYTASAVPAWLSSSRPRTPTSEAPRGHPLPEDDEHTQPVSPVAGPDFTLWLLISVAAIAVIGLIPLWLFVYRAYNAPPPVPTPSSTATVAPPTSDVAEELVTVPNLVGQSAADAQRTAESVRLRMEVSEEEETVDARPGEVLRQTPPSSDRIAAGGVVSVTLAAGRPLVLPNVIGYDMDTVLEGLESDGLIVDLQWVRSTEARGTILEQTPSPDTQVRAGDMITLTLSGGSDVAIPLDVNLNDQVVLEQAWVSQFSYRPGGAVPVTLRWRVLEPFATDYKVFIHILTLDGARAIAQQDVGPVSNLRPTTSWSPGDIISDPHQVPLPEDAPPGTYQVRVGLYNDAGRLPVVDAGETEAAADTIYVTTIEVQP